MLAGTFTRVWSTKPHVARHPLSLMTETQIGRGLWNSTSVPHEQKNRLGNVQNENWSKGRELHICLCFIPSNQTPLHAWQFKQREPLRVQHPQLAQVPVCKLETPNRLDRIKLPRPQLSVSIDFSKIRGFRDQLRSCRVTNCRCLRSGITSNFQAPVNMSSQTREWTRDFGKFLMHRLTYRWPEPMEALRKWKPDFKVSKN
jgi:hypothetical protein